MNIYFISFYRIPHNGTHSIYIMNMCSALASLKGIHLTLLINKFNKNNNKSSVWDFYGIDKKFEIKYFPRLFHFSEKFPSLKKTLLSFFNFVYFFGKFVHDREDFVVYSNHLKIIRLFEFLKRVLRNSKYRGFFIDLHSLKNNKSLLKRCAGIITVTQSMKNDMLAGNLVESTGKIIAAHNGVKISNYSHEINKDETKKSLGIPLNKTIILYTGRINREKGAELLLEAYQKIHHYEKTLLVMVGKNYSEKISSYVSSFPSRPILLPGFVEPNKVINYQLCADILVLPSTLELSYSRHTSPMKLFEYMILEKPIVASDLESIMEIIKHKQNGILFKSGDTCDLAAAIDMLLQDRALSEKISQQARADVENYTWSKRAEKIAVFITNSFSTNDLK